MRVKTHGQMNADLAELDAEINRLLASDPAEAALAARKRSLEARMAKLEERMSALEVQVERRLDAFGEDADERIRDAAVAAAEAVKRLR